MNRREMMDERHRQDELASRSRTFRQKMESRKRIEAREAARELCYGDQDTFNEVFTEFTKDIPKGVAA